eukprot:2362319-Pleurochrysis_carterae.AAC.3
MRRSFERSIQVSIGTTYRRYPYKRTAPAADLPWHLAAIAEAARAHRATDGDTVAGASAGALA